MAFRFLEIDDHNKPKEYNSIRKMFTVKPQKLILKQNEITNVTISFLGSREVEFVNVPVFNCVILEQKYANLVMSFNLKVTAKTHFARYSLVDSKNFLYDRLFQV